MMYRITPYVVAQGITTAIWIIIAVFAYRRRGARGGWPMFLLSVALSIWAFANSLEAAAVSRSLKIFWLKVACSGTQTSPVFLLLMAAEYTGHGKRITPRFTAMLFIVPILIIILAATNEMHGLIWGGFEPGLPGSNSIVYQRGPLFWLSGAYTGICCFLAITLLVFSAVGSQKLYRQQSRFILAASLFPWLGVAVYAFDLNPFPGLDIISVSFLFTGLLILFAFQQMKWMDVVPIPHEWIIEHVDDAVVVIDYKHRLVDINPAAESLLGLDKGEDLGQQVEKSIIFWNQVASKLDMQNSTRREINFSDDGRTVDVKISPLKDRSRVLLGWVMIVSDISDLKEIEFDLQKTNNRLQKRLEEINGLQERLRDQAIHDSLTGVFNRRYLEETLPQELAQAAREEYPLSVIMLDVDCFKEINDQYGHKMGDEVIAAVGKLLKEETRQGDCVSRYGGDEFVVIMPGMSQDHAFQRAEFWRIGLKAMVFQRDGQLIPVTVSIGVVTFPMNGRTSDELLDAVDMAMYRAKQDGRDRTWVGIF